MSSFRNYALTDLHYHKIVSMVIIVLIIYSPLSNIFMLIYISRTAAHEYKRNILFHFCLAAASPVT